MSDKHKTREQLVAELTEVRRELSEAKRSQRTLQSLIVNDPASHPDSIGTPEGYPPLKAFLGVHLLQSGKTIGMNDLLGLAIRASSKQEYLDGVVSLVRKWSGCCCVGIRILDEEGNIPYESYAGFEREFWEQENWLSLTRDNCACIRVITGEPEPQDACCMSPGGSFVVNDSAKLAEALSEEELKRFRGTCIRSGFLSVAVIPIRHQTRVVGAIHMADRKPEMVPEGLISLLESLTPLIGEAISKFRLKDALTSHYEAKLRLAAIVESSNDAIISRGLDGFITSWNHAAERIYGYSAEEAIGCPITLIHPPESGEESHEMLRRAERGERIVNYETVRMRKDGERIDVSLSVSPIVNASGELVGVSSIHRDISDRKRAEEELQVYMRKLQESNQALQDFASIASHDMREPLRKIIAFGNRLKSKHRDSLDSTGQDFLERMIRAADRMDILLNALLEYSRVATKAEPFIKVNLASLTREVMEDLEVRIAETGGKVELGSLPTIHADPTQMRQLFQNLIGNALKYHGEDKPVVRVHSEPLEGGRKWRIEVTDNGIGFEQEYAERIFAPFQRLHGRSEFEGVGMGLTICKKIVERHGGSIRAESTPGKGTKFIITLPASHK